MQRSSEGAGGLLTLGVAAAGAFFVSASVLTYLHSRGSSVLRWQRIPLASSEMVPERGHCYQAPLGHGDWMSAHAGPSIAQVLEDGRVLGPANSMHEDIRQSGGGRYSFWHDQLYFSTSDGSDPRHNGRRYEVYWPHPVGTGWLVFMDGMAVVLLGLATWVGYHPYARRLREVADEVMDRLEARGLTDPLVVATIVGLCAWGVRLAHYRSVSSDPAHFITGSSVMGVPFSDAMQWDKLGEAVARGEGLRGGWSARRPFYAIVLGLIYAWTGPSSAVAIHVNLILGALTAALICRLGSAVYHPLAGVVAGLAFAIDPGAIEQSLATLSEALGLFLFVLGLHLLVRSGLETNLRAAFGGGTALALSNLARPLAVLFEPAAALILCGAPWRKGRGLQGAYRAPALFLVAIVLVTTPWLVRQKLVHGMATLSDNGPAALYAVSSPRYGTWSAAVDREAQAAGVPSDLRSRYEYFSAALLRNLRERPQVFLANARLSGRIALESWARQPWQARALIAISALLFGTWKLGRMAGPRAGVAWVVLCGLSVVAVFSVPGVVLLIAAGAGLVLGAATAGGRLGLLLPAAFLATLLGLAIAGLGGEARLLVTMRWVVPFASTFVCIWLLGRIAARLEGAQLGQRTAPTGMQPPLVTSLRRGLRELARLVVVLAVLAGTYLLVRTIWPKALAAPGVPSLAQERMVFERVRAVHPDLFAPGELGGEGGFFRAQKDARGESIQDWEGKLVAMLARIDRHRYVLPRGLVVSHYSRMFAERDYRRTFFYPSGRTPDGTPGPPLAMIGGVLPDVDPAQTVLIAGRASVDMRFPYEELLLEVMAIVPTRSDGQPDWDRLRLARGPNHVARLRALRPD